MVKGEKIIWIGLAKVSTIKESDIFGGDHLAFTNALGLASSKYQFRNLVKSKLQSLELKLLRIENAEPFADRISKFQINGKIKKLVKKIDEKNNVEFSTFHSFPDI